jgi:hypothetical protein
MVPGHATVVSVGARSGPPGYWDPDSMVGDSSRPRSIDDLASSDRWCCYEPSNQPM